ncbi:MAG TPA: cytochrome c [Humisphaera sp.]
MKMVHTLSRALRPRLTLNLGSLVLAGSALALIGGVGCDGESHTNAPAAGGSAAVQDGRRWFAQTCVACHGVTGQGVPHQGPSLRGNAFIAGHSDDQLVDFLKAGRAPDDPKSVTKIAMPARGGKPDLTDDQLRQIAAYLREMQKS